MVAGTHLNVTLYVYCLSCSVSRRHNRRTWKGLWYKCQLSLHFYSYFWETWWIRTIWLQTEFAEGTSMTVNTKGQSKILSLKCRNGVDVSSCTSKDERAASKMYLSATVASLNTRSKNVHWMFGVDRGRSQWDRTDEQTFVLCLTFSGSEGVTRTCVLWTQIPHGNRKADRYCGRKQCDMSVLPPTLHTASGAVMTPWRRLVSCCEEDAKSGSYVIQGNMWLREFRLPSRCRYGLRCCGLLRSVSQVMFTDVSGQPVDPILKGQAILDLENGTDRLFRNVGEQLQTYDAQQHRRAETSNKLLFFKCPVLLKPCLEDITSIAHGRPWFSLRRDLAGRQERLPKGRLLSCDLDGYNISAETSHSTIFPRPEQRSFTRNVNLCLTTYTPSTSSVPCHWTAHINPFPNWQTEETGVKKTV
jgi:hypothetical protein